MAPTLTASYFVKTSTASAAALSTPSFTPVNGEVIVVKMETWDTGTSMGSVTGGGQTYTSRVTVAPGGFRPWVGISTAVISGSPGSMTVSATPSASARCSMVVERWSSAQLAATPALGSGNGGSGAASGSLTTAAANSVVSWVVGDAQSLDPATRAYLSSATDEGVRDDHVGSNGVGYHAWQSAASAGSQTFGLSAPTGMQWDIAGIEVQAAAGGATVAPDGVSVPVALGSPTFADGSLAAAPAGISVAAALGSPALAWSATAAPDGISALVAAGSPTLAWSGSIAPDGASVPVALGSPFVGTVPLAPDGITLPVALGSPVLAWSGSISPDGVPVAVALGAPTLNIPGSTVTRPNTGTVTRPNTGTVARPDTGTVTRP